MEEGDSRGGIREGPYDVITGRMTKMEREMIEREMYTFAEYCKDFGITESLDQPLSKYLVFWDVYGEYYKEHCETADLEYEDLDDA